METLSSGETRRKRQQKEDQTKRLKDLRSELTRGPSLVRAKPARWSGSGSDGRQQSSKQRLVEEEEMTHNVFSHRSCVKSEGLTSGVKEPETLNQTRTRSSQNLFVMYKTQQRTLNSHKMFLPTSSSSSSSSSYARSHTFLQQHFNYS